MGRQGQWADGATGSHAGANGLWARNRSWSAKTNSTGETCGGRQAPFDFAQDEPFDFAQDKPAP
jgi:hypothetical protein